MPSAARPEVTGFDSAVMADGALGGADSAQEPASHVGGVVLPADDQLLGLRLGLQQRASAMFRRHLGRLVRRVSVLLLADFLTVSVLDLLLTSLRVGGLVGDGLRVPLVTSRYLVALALGLYVTGCYSSGYHRRSGHRLLYGVLLATLLESWSVVWSAGVSTSVLLLIVGSTVLWAALWAERLMVDRLVVWLSPARHQATRTVFVGPAEMCREAAAYPALNAPHEFANLGFLDVRQPAAPDALGAVEDFARVLHDLGVETVVVCGFLPDLQLHALVSVALAAGCHILTVPRAIEVAGVHPAVIWSHGSPLMELTAPALRARQRLLKRAMDILGAATGLLLVSPLLAVIAVLIWLDSPGPVFFRQVRIGRGGRSFLVWKFRTMTHGASDAAHRDLMSRMLSGDDQETSHTGRDGRAVYKLVHDARVTRIGRWLRRTSLDELPQLFNVVRGEMSLVGPRPPLDYEFEAYDLWQYDRLQVRPGITGLWQVSGRNLLTYRQMCELDVEYVRNWSIRLDLKILLRTVPVVLFNSGRAA